MLTDKKNDSWELVGQWDFHGTVMVINGTLMAIEPSLLSGCHGHITNGDGSKPTYNIIFWMIVHLPAIFCVQIQSFDPANVLHQII